jgi:hypothetical protein
VLAGDARPGAGGRPARIFLVAIEAWFGTDFRARAALDAAIFAAYGWPIDLPDEAILARLLALNLERPPASCSPPPVAERHAFTAAVVTIL